MAKKKKKALVVETMSTLAAAAHQSSTPVITSYSRQRASAAPATDAPAAPAVADDGTDCDMRAARHEVFQLGLEGMSRERRRDARLQLLVRLGAKPPPRTATNYRQLMEAAKERRVADREEREKLKKSGLALPNVELLKDLKKFKKPRDKNRVRGFDGQPGRFKKGVQIVPRRVRKS